MVVAGSFLESHQDTGLVQFHRAADKKFDAQHGLAAAGPATDDGGAPFWQTAAGDLVKTEDTGRALL